MATARNAPLTYESTPSLAPSFGRTADNGERPAADIPLRPSWKC